MESPPSRGSVFQRAPFFRTGYPDGAAGRCFTDPDDIAALALFLASDSAKSIAGQTIPIDGGSKAAQ
ncbi:SDR family oxidoreductase [Streptomyces misionensis]|uniref:SDR family oxidoreductase n=1 Tax=Streptomyces misionensis TaxID=67331 RepID=A0A5C6JW00_9ACTN|nr:SDR family oxidoreductase [Streptomyces misionensis]TWV53495.1 SDR family oxidoreductase [Streptomyces misionensis]